MKIHVSLLSVILLLSYTCFAQSEEDNFVVHGQIKTIIINKKSLKNSSESQVEKRNYDKTGKMISKITSGKYVQEYYYKGAPEPVLTANYEVQNPTQQSWNLKQYDTHGKLLLTADIGRDGNIDGLDTYKDQDGQLNHNNFTGENEIYSNLRIKRISLTNMTFPNEMIPFTWDKELSEGTDQYYISYSNPEETNKAEHTVKYKIVEKGNPGNWLKIEYATDGKGYWYRYLNNKIYQERYISNKANLSDFGHLYNYDKQGKLISDTYGYFAKIAGGIYMQRKEIAYDSYGNIIKQTEFAENAKPYEIKYSYEYDQRNNWIVKVEKYEDGSGSSTTRKLEYYIADEAVLTNVLSEADYVAKLAKAVAQADVAEQKYKIYLSPEAKPATAPLAVITGWKMFLPAGQVLDTISYGDLNKDGLEDVVIVFQPKKALQHQRNTTRELRILFKQQDGKYLMAAKSNLVVMPENDGNIFFTDTQIKNGVLIVNHEFLRGGCSHIYRYQNGGFYLIGARNNTGDPTYNESFEYNLSTGKYIYDYSNDDDDTKSVKKEGVQKLNPLPKIETFELFSIEVDGKRF